MKNIKKSLVQAKKKKTDEDEYVYSEAVAACTRHAQFKTNKI